MIIIETRTDPNVSGSLVDTAALGIHDFKPTVSYSHATRVEFEVRAANHTLPFALDDFLVIWDDEHDFESSNQTDDNPFFEGWVEEINPGNETNSVTIVAYDPTYRLAKQQVVMNGPSNESEAYPRAVFNVPQDNDDDYAFSILQNATLAQIIIQVLLDAQADMYALGCSPEAPALPYVAADLGGFGSSDSDSDSITDWTGDLNFIPQEKVVSQSETHRAFLQRLLSQYAPATKMIWQPGERVLRFVQVKDSPQKTITCNDPDNADGMVLALEMHRSAEGRYGAVKFFGPEGIEWAEAVWDETSSDNTLEPIETYTAGESPYTYTCLHKFQITDGTFTRICRKGPYQVYIPGPFALWTNSAGTLRSEIQAPMVQTWSPSLQVRYSDAEWGSSDWKTMTGWRMDARSGIIDFGDVCLTRWEGAAGGNDFEVPVAVKFVYPRLTTPLSVRYPETGYEGTIESVAGIENELKLYDEALSVDKSYGIPVTTPLRRSRFFKMARQIHSSRKDLIYTGTIVLEGLHYEFLRLNQRVNIAAKDDNGDTLTTGWEAINAILTDCELDPVEFTTTLQFSSDQLEILGIDPEMMKRRLNIRTAERQFRFSFNVAYSYRRERTMTGIHLLQSVDVDINQWWGYVDEFGNEQ